MLCNYGSFSNRTDFGFYKYLSLKLQKRTGSSRKNPRRQNLHIPFLLLSKNAGNPKIPWPHSQVRFVHTFADTQEFAGDFPLRISREKPDNIAGRPPFDKQPANIYHVARQLMASRSVPITEISRLRLWTCRIRNTCDNAPAVLPTLHVILEI